MSPAGLDCCAFWVQHLTAYARPWADVGAIADDDVLP